MGGAVMFDPVSYLMGAASGGGGGGGGDIPLCRYNFAVNWDFSNPSNSRSSPSYPSSGTGVWAIDGWQIFSGTVSIETGGIKLTGDAETFGYFAQWMTNDMSSRLNGQVLTLSGWVDDEVKSVTFTLNNTSGVQGAVSFDGLDFYVYRNDSTTVALNIGGILSDASDKLIKAIKLEIGNTQTLAKTSDRIELMETTTPLTEMIRTRQTVRYS